MASKAWPEWLTPEHSAIHTAFENEIVKALEHCYASADAADMDWTTEGWISCSASNIMSLLRRLGCPPPPVEPGLERLSADEVARRWAVPWDEEEEPHQFDGPGDGAESLAAELAAALYGAVGVHPDLIDIAPIANAISLWENRCVPQDIDGEEARHG